MVGALKLIVRLKGPTTLHRVRYKGMYAALQHTAEQVYRKVMLDHYPTVKALFKAVTQAESKGNDTGLNGHKLFTHAQRFKAIERRAHHTAFRHWMVPPAGMSFKMYFWRDET